MGTVLREIYTRLYDAYGPQHWWPADSPLEVIVGALLVQNTSWRAAERAIGNLKEAGLLHAQALYDTDPQELETLIRSAGYYRIKVRRLRNVLELLLERYNGSVEQMFQQDPQLLRQELLEINGVGPETADSILLYAGNIPVFVVDTYTKRVVVRHGWMEPDADYHTIQQYFEENLESDAKLYNEYHALLVRVGREHCRRSARCEGCPLADLLPPGGPCEPQ